MDVALSDHFEMIATRIRDGVLIPFLGAGVNLCGRAESPFEPGGRPPSAQELADEIAELSNYPADEARELIRVAQYMAVREGDGALYFALHRIFDHDYPPTALHELFAALPAVARQESHPSFQLIVTTNYDDLLERAFDNAGEEYDVLTYFTDRDRHAKLLHRRPDGTVKEINSPKRYRSVSLEERPVIVKIHGAIDRADEENDSYVITEDHYIHYLIETDIRELIPASLTRNIRLSHFLFLGYGLRDWNLRVILHRIWGEKRMRHNSWAVQLDPDMIDQMSWRARGNVEIMNIPLIDYVDGLSQTLVSASSSTGAAGA